MKTPDCYALYRTYSGELDGTWPTFGGAQSRMLRLNENENTAFTIKPVCIVPPALLDWADHARRTLGGFTKLRKDLPLGICDDMLAELEKILPGEEKC